MKLSRGPTDGPAPGTYWPPRLAGRLIPGVSHADRYRLAVVRTVFLHFLSQDARLGPEFEILAKRLGHQPPARALAALRRQNADESKEQQGLQRLVGILQKTARQTDSGLGGIAKKVLHVDAPWIRRELAVIYYRRHLGLLAVDPSERPASAGLAPAPGRVVIEHRCRPGETMAEARGAVLAQVNALFPIDLDSDGSRAPRHGARYLADYVFWWYLRRCLGASERGVAEKLAGWRQDRDGKVKRPSRALVRKGVHEVDRLFGLFAPDRRK